MHPFLAQRRGATKVRFVGDVENVENGVRAVGIGIFHSLFHGGVLAPRRGGTGRGWKRRERNHRVVPAGAKLALAQFLQRCFNIGLVFHHIPVWRRAHCSLLKRRIRLPGYRVLARKDKATQCTKNAVAATPTPARAAIVPPSQNGRRFVSIDREHKTSPRAKPNSEKSKYSAWWCACLLSSIFISASFTNCSAFAFWSGSSPLYLAMCSLQALRTLASCVSAPGSLASTPTR